MNEAIKILLVLWLISIPVGAVNAFAFYGSTVYPGDFAKDWLSRARATNDLNDMSTFLGKAEAILENYHGNPGWPYPAPATDFDQIRLNIQEDIRTANSLVANSTMNSLAYQQAVQNLQETINEVIDHLDNALGAIWINPSLNPLGWLLTIWWLFSTIALAMYGVTRD